MRSFQFTAEADTNYHNLYSKLITLTGAIPTDGIFPDRVAEVTIGLDTPQNSAGNGGMILTIADRNQQGGLAIEAGGSNTWRSNRNTICLKDFYYKQTTPGSLVINISVHSN